MADNEHTRRARELLRSSTEALERSRNRAHVEVGSWRSERFEQGMTQVVHEPRAKPHRRAAMNPASSKAWNDWARDIAAKQAMMHCEALRDAICDTLGKRIAELEREVQHLKGIAPDREEWPLRVVDGGKR